MNTENMPSEQETLRQELTDYLVAQDPLGIGVYKLEPLPAAEYNQNFKLTTSDKCCVVRMCTLELSSKTNFLDTEYQYLEYLSKYDMSPQVYHLDMAGHQHPFLIEEFIEGEVFTELSDENLDKCADALVALYETPLEAGHPFEIRIPSYQTDLDYYLGVYREYEGSEEIAHWAERVETSLAQLEPVLEKSAPLLQQAKPKLIRRDANPRNLIDNGERFVWIDWEVARVDDPVITLASFINETELYDWFEPKLQSEQRERVVTRFLEKTQLQHGQDLLTARLLLERFWGMIWAIERIYKHKHGELPEHLSTPERLERYEFIATESYDALQRDLAAG